MNATSPATNGESLHVRLLERAYKCRVLLCREEGGGYSALALELPGVASQGNTKREALANVAEAFRGAISVYLDDGGKIPWTDAKRERPADSEEHWLLVDV